MTAQFQFPEDLYYWGQDRRGSFEPLIGHFLLQISQSIGIRVSPFLLLSVIQFSLIGAAYWSLSSFLKFRLSKVIFAFVWFLPPAGLSNLLMLAHPYYAQFAFLGLGLLGIKRLEDKNSKLMDGNNDFSSVTEQLFIAAIVICLCLSIWISELSAFPLLVLLIRLSLVFVESVRKSKEKDYLIQRGVAVLQYKGWNKKLLCNIGLFFTGTMLAITYAKFHADEVASQPLIANLEEIFQNLQRISSRLSMIFAFQANNAFLSFACCGLFMILIYLVATAPWHRLQRRSQTFYTMILKNWGFFFFISFLSSSLFLVMSKWVYLNNTHSRYFAFPFILFALSLLLLTEDYLRSRPIVKLVLTLCSLVSAFSFPFSLSNSAGFVPVRKNLQAFRDLPYNAFIGDYWPSYLICSVDPLELDCTPHESSHIRCTDCIEDIISTKKNVYLIKENWFVEFPEELKQFNKILIKTGKPEIVGPYTIAPYKFK